jgi:uncharacterized protein YbbK (DUF523 family)
VSACLLGQPVRYDGQAKTRSSAILDRWRAEGRLVSFCPELAGGLGVPRPPAELVDGRVLTAAGDDVTSAFVRGARLALEAAVASGVRVAILKEGSPSCGSHRIYDGTFSGTSVEGQGLTASLLVAHGIEVFSEDELEAADAALLS